MSDHMKIWNAVKTPPRSALKEIKGGRLKGMTDISPQWRMQVLTEQFGPVGFGWTYEIVDKWTEPGPGEQVAAFVNVLLFVRIGEEWSKGIPGTGGSMLVVKESAGLHFSDEAFKMATTDAISVAAKALGVGSDVYMGQLDSKYQKRTETKEEKVTQMASPAREGVNADIVKALSILYGDDGEAKKNRLIELTSWVKDGKTITGKADYRQYSEKQAAIVAKELKKQVDQMEDAQ